MTIQNKDAYVFENDREILLFLYMKLEPRDLQNALPISYVHDKDMCYLTCILDSDGRDYIGQKSLKDIQKMIQNDNEFMNINHDYETIKSSFPTITYELLDKYKCFADKHFVDKSTNQTMQRNTPLLRNILWGVMFFLFIYAFPCMILVTRCN